MRRRLSLSAVLLALAWLAALALRRSSSWGTQPRFADQPVAFEDAVWTGWASGASGPTESMSFREYRQRIDAFRESDWLPSTYRRRGVL